MPNINYILVFNLPGTYFCSGNGCVEGIVTRLKTYRDPDLCHDIKVRTRFHVKSTGSKDNIKSMTMM